MFPTLTNLFTLAQQAPGPAAGAGTGGGAATVAVSLALLLAGGIYVRCSRGKGSYADILLGGMFVAALAGSSVIARIFTTGNELALSGIAAVGEALGMGA